MRIHVCLCLFILVECKFNYEYCKKVCQRISHCVEKCNYFIDNGLTNNYQTPHCGLTRLNNLKKRVVGGYESKAHKYPWFVILFTKKYYGRHYFCGGSIINNRFIITAAHCVKSKHNYRIDGFVMGTNKLYQDEYNHIVMRPLRKIEPFFNISINQIYVHEEYEGRGNDIALIKLSRPIEFLIQNDEFVINSICLQNINKDPVGKAVFAGIGSFAIQDNVRNIELQIIDNNKCTKITKESIKQAINYNITAEGPSSMCTIRSVSPGSSENNYKGPVEGDSGSPLFQFSDDIAYAIGIATERAPYSLNFYSRISYYVPWIKQVIDKADKDASVKFDKDIPYFRFDE